MENTSFKILARSQVFEHLRDPAIRDLKLRLDEMALAKARAEEERTRMEEAMEGMRAEMRAAQGHLRMLMMMHHDVQGPVRERVTRASWYLNSALGRFGDLEDNVE